MKDIKSPDSYNTLLDLGEVCQENKDYRGAIIYYSKALEQRPNDKVSGPVLYYNMAHSHYHLNNRDKAKENLTKCLELNPEYYDAYAFRGAILTLEESYSEALTNLENALVADKFKLELYLYKAVCCTSLELYDKALASYDKLIEHYPENSKLHFFKGEIYTMTMEYDRAIESLGRSIELDLGSFELGGSQISFKDKDLKGIIDACGFIIAFDPGNFKAYLLRGIAGIKQFGCHDQDAVADIAVSDELRTINYLTLNT